MNAGSRRREPRLENVFDDIPENVDRIILAYSGGLDSCVLLHLLISAKKTGPALKLWHVNHGLLPEAGEMETFCRLQADQYGLNIQVSQLNLRSAVSNLEALARDARYALFAGGMEQRDCLLTAHHADDQAETLLLNLLRGSGSAGLRGIARARTIGQSRLIRPLLNFGRVQLLDYANQHQLAWFDDPSNASERFNRNYLRHKVMPLIRDRWPGYLESMAHVCEIQAQTQQALDELAAIDYEQVCVGRNQTSAKTMLDIERLLSLSRARQNNLIRYWIGQNGCSGLQHARLGSLVEQLHARHDASPMISNDDYDIRIYAGRLFLVDRITSAQPAPVYHAGLLPTIHIDEINLVLERNKVFERFGLSDEGQQIAIKFRHDSNIANPHAHRLKRLFQKHKIPPWQRSHTPQIFINNDLVGLWD